VRTQNCSFIRYAAYIVFFAWIVGLGIMAAPSNGLAQNGTFSRTPSYKRLIHRSYEISAIYAVANQDAGQAPPPAVAPPAPAPPQPIKVELPEGDGKPIATEFCQDCHRLTNLARAHKSSEDWHETVELMIDRGARLPQEKVDSLVQYLAKNFGPKTDAPASDAPPVAASAVASPTTASGDATPSAPAQAKPVELPDGDGKEIATENCQACHKLTNLVKAHKSLDDWRETVQLMIDRGAKVPAEKVDTLVQYLTKNFGPKVADPATGAPSVGIAPSSTSQTQ